MLAVLALPSLTRPRHAQPPAPRAGSHRALVLAGGVGLLVAGLGRRPLWLALALAVPGVVVAWFALVGLLPPGTARAARGVPATVATGSASASAFFGTDTFIPLAATRIHGATTLVGGLMITGATFTWTVGSLDRRGATGRTPPSTIVRLGFVLLAVGVAAHRPGRVVRRAAVGSVLPGRSPDSASALVFNTTSVTTMASAAARRRGTGGQPAPDRRCPGFALVGGVGGALVALAGRDVAVAVGGAGHEFLVALGFAAARASALAGRRQRRADGQLPSS